MTVSYVPVNGPFATEVDVTSTDLNCFRLNDKAALDDSSNSDSDEEPSKESIVKKFTVLYEKWKEVLKTNSVLTKYIATLKTEKVALSWL